MTHPLKHYDFLLLRSYDDEAAFFAQMGRFFASATVRRDCGGYPLNDGPRHRWFIVRRHHHARLLNRYFPIPVKLFLRPHSINLAP